MKRFLLVLATISCIFTACENGLPDEESGKTPSIPKIELSQQTVDVEFEPNTYTVEVSSPYSWRAVSENDWITVESTTGIAGTEKLKFSVKRNEKEKERKGTIVVLNSNYHLVAELYIIQKAFVPSEIIITPETINFTNDGGTQNVNISTNFEYEITTDAKWLSIERKDNGINITASTHFAVEERLADIVVFNEKYGISKTIKITQDGADEIDLAMAEITTSPTTFAVGLEGDVQAVTVTSNGAWVATCLEGDVQVSPAMGNGNGTVVITVPEATTNRNFVVTFVATKQTLVPGTTMVSPTTAQAEVSVSQNAGGQDMSEFIYYEKCGDDVEKNGAYWPYVDAFTGWSKEGNATTAVTYGGNNASVRASGTNYQPTEEAVGVSGQPYVFLNKVPASAHFLINNIAVKGDAQYIFTFNVSCQNAYDGGKLGFATVDNSLVHLELSYDGATWAKVNFTATPNGGNGWYATTTEFKTAADATKLYARFTYEAPASNGGGRFDDFKLVEGGNGSELNFTIASTQVTP